MARISRKETALKTAMYIRTAQFVPTALYIRRSVEELHKDIDPIEHQKLLLSQYLQDIEELKLHKMYIDNGYTGRTFERPAFEEMLEEIETGKIKCVIFKDFSRLGRNTITTGYYLEKYFPLHNIRVISINDNYDSDKTTNNIVVPLTNMFNEMVAKDTSRKVKAVLDSLSDEGKFIGARAPYGYKKADDDCRQLVIDDEVAPIVKSIFLQVANGVPFNQIVFNLNQKKILSPSAYYNEKTDSHTKGSNEWHSWTLHKILKSEVYIGNLVQGKTKVSGGKQVKTPVGEWKRTNNTHEALVSIDIFNKVQETFKRNKEQQDNRNKNKSSNPKNIFSKKIFCAECGRAMHHSINHGIERYRCLTKYRVGKEVCSASSFSKIEISYSAFQLLKEQEKKIKSFLSAFDVSEIHRLMEDTAKQMLECKKYIDEADKRMTNLFEDFISNKITQEQFVNLKKAHEKRSYDDVQSFEGYIKQLDFYEEQLSAFKNSQRYLAENRLGSKLTHKAVETWIDKIEVASDKIPVITFAFNDYKLLEVK